MRLDLTERARRDIRDARTWYETRRIGLGDRLYDDITATIDNIVANPYLFTEWKRGVRSVWCREFPYRVVYRIKLDVVRVMAVYHLRRDPDRWNDPNR